MSSHSYRDRRNGRLGARLGARLSRICSRVSSGPLNCRYPSACAFFVILAALAVVAPADSAFAQLGGTSNFHIVWEVKNRFRLFRDESDFLRMAAASRSDGILAAERRLEKATAGYGWAKDIVGHLCLDPAGNLTEWCERDGERENYLAPRDHHIGVRLSGTTPAGATCVWTFEDGQEPPKRSNAPCGEEIQLRVRYGHPTVGAVDVMLAGGTAQRAVAEIAVRDVLIAGLGDSIASGEGNPDGPVKLEGGFCFKRFLTGGQYFRPGRAGYSHDRSCGDGPSSEAALDWAHHGARWMNPPCHRSLYGYQVRTALTLAIEQPHIAVTFLPLACTGATIEAGMFNSEMTDDCPWVVGIDNCSGTAPAQLTQLKELMTAARRQDPKRSLDMVMLTIGANDVDFGALVANVIVDAATERLIFKKGGGIVSVEDSQKKLDGYLPGEFARLRAALKPFVGGNLARVLFVSYVNPGMRAENKPCSGGRDGFDVHPAFGVDGNRLRAAAEFVDAKFLPKIKALATCNGNRVCHDPLSDRMTFVDAHQAAFERHGMCVRAPSDPQFDRTCFSETGHSFKTDLSLAADDPMACELPASDYRPYASRARWIRTANDSYFTAMTYPVGMPVMLRPSDIHDALWGVSSAVYGGAVHPTAEGYAAMADAALPAAREILGLSVPPASRTEGSPFARKPKR